MIRSGKTNWVGGRQNSLQVPGTGDAALHPLTSGYVNTHLWQPDLPGRPVDFIPPCLDWPVTFFIKKHEFLENC